jgi:hypothetical protein
MAGDFPQQGGLLILTRELVLSPALVNANTTAEQLFSCPGLRPGDKVQISKPTAQAGLGVVGARCSTPDNIGITFANTTAGGLTPTAAETYAILATRG